MFFLRAIIILIYWVLDFLDMLEKDYFEDTNDNNTINNNYTKYTNFSSKSKSTYVKNRREIELLYVILLCIGDLLSGFLVSYTYVRMNCKTSLK